MYVSSFYVLRVDVVFEVPPVVPWVLGYVVGLTDVRFYCHLRCMKTRKKKKQRRSFVLEWYFCLLSPVVDLVVSHELRPFLSVEH